MPIWRVSTKISFNTVYYIVAEEMPDGLEVIQLSKDGYVPEFSQEASSEGEHLIGIAGVSEGEYLDAWHPSITISKEEKIGFLVNIDVKMPEDLSGVGTEETL